MGAQKTTALQACVLLTCLLLGVSAGAQTEKQRVAAAGVLTKFYRLADSRPAQYPEACQKLLRRAQEALADFKITQAGVLSGFVQALETAATEYDQLCRAGGQPAPKAWAHAGESVYQAEEQLAKALEKPSPAPAPAEAPKPAETPPPPVPAAEPKSEEKPPVTPAAETEAKPAEEAPTSPGQPGDPKIVDKAKAVLVLVQKLDSAMDLGLGKEELQTRLIDAHAALQEFASAAESKEVPLTVANLRLAVAYYRRRLDTDDSFAIASAKEALQKAREALANYEASGLERAPKP